MKKSCDVRSDEKTRMIHEGPTPQNLILSGLTGSRAYGLQHNGYVDPQSGDWVASSDTDTRGVFVVPTKEVLSLGRHKEIVEQRESDTKFDEVERFIELCLRCNPERLEFLGWACRSSISEPNLFMTPEGSILVSNYKHFLSKLVIQTYGGYAKQQLYRIKSKKERKTKPAMHLIRLMLTGIRILEEGMVDCDMSEYRQELMAIRTGAMTLEEVLNWHKALETKFQKAAEATKLPDKPDRERFNTILLDIRRNHLKW